MAGPTNPAQGETTFWGRSITCDPAQESEAARTFFASVRPPADCPDEAVAVDIAFEQGIPTTLNGVPLPLVELVASLNTLASTHGVGRAMHQGLLCHAPAAVLVHAAHRALTHAAVAPDVARVSGVMTTEYVSLVEQAGWFSPLRPALDAFTQVAQARVSGQVHLSLFRGSYETLGVELSPPSGSRPAVLPLSSRKH
jgi:argininosuccinate synthase